FASPASSVFTSQTSMDQIVTPLIQNLTGQGAGTPAVTIATQPTDASVRQELYNLIGALMSENAAVSTRNVTMGACTALLSSATTLLY
ncbi:MAG: hypothetical protein ACREU2_03495, partial [Steroidobacteraceae bacterium]